MVKKELCFRGIMGRNREEAEPGAQIAPFEGLQLPTALGPGGGP